MKCDVCQAELTIGMFPFCGGDPSKHVIQANSVIGDEIDISIKNGHCWPDGSPRRWRSREALKREEKRTGIVNTVRHVGTKGGDKSKHTTQWY